MEKLLEPRLIITSLMVIGLVVLGVAGTIGGDAVATGFAMLLAKAGVDKTAPKIKREETK
jgi:hypothetical protein